MKFLFRPRRLFNIVEKLRASQGEANRLLRQANVELTIARREIATARTQINALKGKLKNPAQRPGLELALKSSILAEAPAILHVSDGLGSEFHIDLWLQHLREALGQHVVVVVRVAALFDAIKARPDVDCIFVRDGRDAENLAAQCPKLKAIFYASNTGTVIHFIRLNHLTHVFLGHGDSEKAASCHRFFRVYDEVWTAGQAHIDRFTASGLDFLGLNFRVVGRPMLRGLLKERPTAATGRFLYLPTWEGYQDSQNYSSLPCAPALLERVADLTDRFPVVKFHPLTGTQKKEPPYREATLKTCFLESEIDIRPRSQAIAGIIHEVDFLISDISSVITDFLATLKPIFVFIPTEARIRLSASQMPYDAYAYLFSTDEELAALVEQVVVQGRDDLAEARRKALDYFIDVEATVTDQFGRELKRLCLAQDPLM